jgi:polysaccharide export outer membrane protein
MNNPVLETADLRAEYESLWMRFAAQQGYVQKLRSKLENDNAHIADSETKTPVREETAQRIDHLVNQDLSLRNAAYQKQRSLHVEAIENEERRIEVLSKSVKRERDGAKNDAQQLERLHDAERRGIISPARMADLRRSALGSETRSLRSEASLIEAERSRDDLKLKLQQLDSNRNIDLAGQLQAATLAMETTRIKLQSASEKLAYSGIIRSQLASGEFSTPEIKVIRGSGVLRQTGTAREDDELQPGDVVEISLRSFGKGLLEQQAGAQAAR